MVDVNGEFGLPSHLKNKYKHTDQVLKDISNMRSDPRLVKAYQNHSGLSASRVDDYLKYENGSPTIHVENMEYEYGKTEPDGSKITIRKETVKGLEKWGNKIESLTDEISSLAPSTDSKKIEKLEKKLNKAKSEFGDYRLQIEAVVLHEGIHKGDIEVNGKGGTDKKGKEHKGKQGTMSNEMGSDFEKEYYGKEIRLFDN